MLIIVAISECDSLTGHVLSERWQIAFNLALMVPLLFMFFTSVRYILRTDELNRKIRIESLAIAGGMTALIAAIYMLLECMSIGFPRPHAAWTLFTFLFIDLIVTLLLRRRYK
jgi:hypothetical protein